ncbi:UDP-3-O-(3-hydroxymyristoyl)glucosamine N-acyltransferase [Aurantivibrio infirmus]
MSTDKMKSWSLVELAEFVGAQLSGDGEIEITGIATLQDADSSQLAFLSNPLYRSQLKTTQAGAVIMTKECAEGFSGNALLIENPYYAYARLTSVFLQSQDSAAQQKATCIAATAVVAEDVKVGVGSAIGPNSVIEANVQIGDGVTIGAGCFIGADTIIGAETRIYANVSIYEKISIGERCVFHSGVVIGADGFGFAPHDNGWEKIHHLSSVRIGDDVELGANTCVDRGALTDTVIGNGVKVDNLVQIAHNVKIGQHTVIAGSSAIAGSTEIGERCMIGGGVGIVGHLSIADGVTITARTLVTKSIKSAGSYSSGSPLMPSSDWRKSAVRFSQLDEISHRLKKLENNAEKK